MRELLGWCISCRRPCQMCICQHPGKTAVDIRFANGKRAGRHRDEYKGASAALPGAI